MYFQLPKILIGLTAAASVISAQAPELHREGPFGLQVKGRAANSSIDGYITWYAYEGVSNPSFLSYEAGGLPTVGNSSYEWYFNYTGYNQYRGFEVGYILANPTANTTTPSPYHGQPMDILYASNSNVGTALLGLGGTFQLGFDAENKTFGINYLDDATFVPRVQPEYSEDLGYYNWAVCWQVSGMYRQTLSWVSTGAARNPTCELVDLVRVELSG